MIYRRRKEVFIVVIEKFICYLGPHNRSKKSRSSCCYLQTLANTFSQGLNSLIKRETAGKKRPLNYGVMQDDQ